MSNEAAEHHDVHSQRHYVRIYSILVVLLIVSVIGPLVSEGIDNRHLARIIVLSTAFGIAIVKAFMVCKHFMHLNVQRKYVLYLLGTMLGFVGMFFSAVSADVMKHEGRNWTNVSAQAAVERGMQAGPVVHHGESDGAHEGQGGAHEAEEGRGGGGH